MVSGQICFRVRFKVPRWNRDLWSRIRIEQTNQNSRTPLLQHNARSGSRTTTSARTRGFHREPPPMKRQAIAEALRDAIAEEMERDETVFCIGEDIAVPGGWGGAFTVTLGLEKRFPERMINTPIAELGFFGIPVGAAMMGMRPIADVQYGDFLFLASDQIINNAAKMRYMSGGACQVPLVMRAPVGATARGSPHPPKMKRYSTGVPRLKFVSGSNAYSGKGILKSAAPDNAPVLIFAPKPMYGPKGSRS